MAGDMVTTSNEGDFPFELTVRTENLRRLSKWPKKMVLYELLLCTMTVMGFYFFDKMPVIT